MLSLFLTIDTGREKMLSCCNASAVHAERDILLPSHNTMFEFLIVLYPSDLKQSLSDCIYGNKRQRFLKQSQYLNGFLHVCQVANSTNNFSAQHTCECCNKPYAIRGVVSRNILYALLPKEGIYVDMQNWYHEYLKSQMMELLYIFRRLGAINVHLTIEKNDDDTDAIEGSGSVSMPNIFSDLTAEAGFKSNTVQHSGNSIDITASYALNDAVAYKRMEDFVSDTKVAYLTQRQDWQDMVVQRIECGVNQLKFSFNVTNSLQVETSFYAKLKQLGMSFNTQSHDQGSFKMTGEVTF